MYAYAFRHHYTTYTREERMRRVHFMHLAHVYKAPRWINWNVAESQKWFLLSGWNNLAKKYGIHNASMVESRTCPHDQYD